MTIRRLTLILRLVGHAFTRGFARSSRHLKKFVVVQPAGLGDMVCVTPLFHAIKQQYPQAYLYVVGQESWKELIAGNPDVDEYIPYKDNPEEVAAYVRTQSIDFGCIPTPSFIGLAILYLGNVQSIVAPEVVDGFNPQQTILYRLLRLLTLRKIIKFSGYMPGEYLKLLEPIGIHTHDTTKHLRHSDAAHRSIQYFFKAQGINSSQDIIVGISPSSGNKIKNWGSEKFALVADYLYERYQARIIVFGGPHDAQEIQTMIAAAKPETGLIPAITIFNLDEIKALVAALHLFIAVDTGPIYIAEAFGVPTIDIVGPVASHEQPPRGKHHTVVEWKGRTSAAIHILNARIYDEKAAREQVDRITPQQVQEAVDDLFALLRQENRLPGTSA